jgi:hypothetical protein
MGALALLVCASAAAAPAVPVHTVSTDLEPLIRAASESPAQFAVLVPHAVSSAGGGQWSSEHGQAIWRYAVTVPTAVSLSFHAIEVLLPASATLIVRGARTTVSYRASDLHRGELWSRIQPGAALEFSLSVAAADRERVAFRIVSLQAGYRSLGAGVPDHPFYRRLKQAVASAGNVDCVVNYACKVSSANAPAAAATVALVVANQYQCTGTLINDVPGDNAPYILTARHCITGKVGVVDSPSAAAATTVYWDASSSCGSALGSIYDTTTPVQTGAQTMVEQQDAWLIRLDVNPVVSDAQFAGFDASGGAVQGGYSVHHAEGYAKQYVAWFGQAALADKFAGFSKFLETVNQTGNIGPGASGSGLFDQNNRLVGSLTYGRDTSDPSGYGACPVTPPAAPNGSNGVADFTSLAAVWNSTLDSTSSTGPLTIKAVLDPQGTGTLVVPSAPAAVIVFSASTQTLTFGQTLQLTWSASNATQCTAGGGVSGDGWSGTLSPAGTEPVIENAPRSVTYTLTCAYSGGRTAKSSTTVNWVGPTPQLTLSASAYTLWTTRPEVLSWTSNVTPCAINGGGLALTNLAASGTTTTTQATSADVTYTLVCCPANNPGEVATLVQYVTPSLTFEANGNDRLLGQAFFLQWQTYADTCTPSGGAPNDGWSSNSFNGGQTTQFAPQVSTAGTYTYTLTCSSGPLTQQQSTTVTFANNPPTVSASLDKSQVAFSASPADYVNLSWNSNLSACSVSSPGLPTSLNDPLGSPGLPQGALTLSPYQSGTYVLSVTCTAAPGSGVANVTSSPLTLTVTPAGAPVVTVTLNPATLLTGEAFTASWSANGASRCDATGGEPGDAWSGQSGPVAGSVTEMAQAGVFTFGMTCQSIDPASPAASAEAQLSVSDLTEVFTVSAATLAEGASFTLTWSSHGATACSASGGGADGAPWSGTLGPAGSVTQKATTPGSFQYTLSCGDGHVQSTEQVMVSVSAPGGGGGGTLDPWELALLGALRARRARRGPGSTPGTGA